jgi:hypothetical protein
MIGIRGFIVVALFTFAFISLASAHDPDDPELNHWYMTLKQPDTGISCCGENDSYFCMEGSRGQQVTCTISDDRDNKKLRRVPVPNGTVVDIPPYKINRDPNLAGRAVVFLSPMGHVYCFVGISGS